MNRTTSNSIFEKSYGYFHFFSNSLSHGDSMQRIKRSLGTTAIRMPGTNWCGGGWRAKSFEHLGAYGPTDKCCR